MSKKALSTLLLLATASGFATSDTARYGTVSPPGPAPSANGTLYCPGNSADMNLESNDDGGGGGSVKFENGGWSFIGGARVSSKVGYFKQGTEEEPPPPLSPPVRTVSQ